MSGGLPPGKAVTNWMQWKKICKKYNRKQKNKKSWTDKTLERFEALSDPILPWLMDGQSNL